MNNLEPLMIMVAPNGARRNQQDHSALPMTIEQTVAEAWACHQAGACILHGHIRDQQGNHSLDAGLYRELLAQMASSVPNMLVQITTEAVGQYTAEQQIALLKTLQPKMASVALRELAPDNSDQTQAKHFFSWAAEAQVHLQIILYDASDVTRLRQLKHTGVIANKTSCVLYVLGRYRKNLQAQADDLDEFLQAKNQDHWFACAFGKEEHACITHAIDNGGHARVGFENNLWLPSGELAHSNQALVEAVANYAHQQKRAIATAQDASIILGIK
ncbi:MAG TPA: class III aminotransferase [Oceanospirillaceae bacterium]|nr:class III aminotransferase [Oceanospirillaceae bacterium]